MKEEAKWCTDSKSNKQKQTPANEPSLGNVQKRKKNNIYTTRIENVFVNWENVLKIKT